MQYYCVAELKSWGFITEFPLVIAVQATHCAPLGTAFFSGLQEISQMNHIPTLAEGIAIAQPVRGTQILEGVRTLGGTFITVTEDQILLAQRALALRGVFVEVSSAVNSAGYLNIFEQQRKLKDIDGIIFLSL